MALRPQPLNILSICTGGAGLDLGVELAIPSARTVCMVEREAFSVATLVSAMEQGHLHPAPVWSDARTFDGRAWRGAVDGLIGGIPCQPHSLAGRKQGSNDARDLWSTARRIIVQSRAWFVVIENVGGMLSAGSDEIAGAQRVFRDLHKLGFQVEGGLFTAAEVGASHQRERIFILAVADTACGERDRQRRIPVARFDQAAARGRASGQSAGASHTSCGINMADADGERLEGVGANARAQGRPDARRSTGLCDGAVMEHTQSFGRRKGRPQSSIWGWRAAAPEPINLFPPGPDARGEWADILAGSPELEPAFRRVADGLASRLDIGRVDRLRMLGNGVVPLQAAYAIRTLVTRLAARGSAGAARLVRMMEEHDA